MKVYTVSFINVIRDIPSSILCEIFADKNDAMYAYRSLPAQVVADDDIHYELTRQGQMHYFVEKVIVI